MIGLISQIALIVIIAAAWMDIARRLKRFDELLRYTYSLAYHAYYSSSAPLPSPEAVEGTGEVAAVGSEAAVEDEDKVKEACVMELLKRGCVDVQEVLDRCSVSKSFIINKLYRKSKSVGFADGGRKICPRRT
jgi:hypothetical protein